MKIALLILLVAVTVAVAGFVGWLTWMNRASEKVVTAVIAAALAFVGAPVAVLVFGTEPLVSEVFPAAFQYETKSKLPINLPWSLIHHRYTFSVVAPAQLQETRPELFSNPNDELGKTLYHHLLQKSLIDWTAMWGGWQMERLRFDLPVGGQQRTGPATNGIPARIIEKEQVQELLKDNWFAGIWMFPMVRVPLPPGGVLRITAPHSDKQKGEIGEIHMENRFFEVSIETRESSWTRSLGMYRFLIGMSLEDSRRMSTATYEVRITASFSRLRGGHPDMPKYRAWVRGLTDGLRDQFDEQLIWKRTREDVLFRKELGIGERDGI